MVRLALCDMKEQRKAERGVLGIILLTIFIDMVGFGIVIPVLPLYAEKFGASGLQIGLLVAAFSACQFFFAPFVGRLSDRYGRRPVLLASVLGTAVGFFIMGSAGSLWMLFAGRIVDGISGANIGTAQACMADITPPEERSRAMGLVGASIGLGFVFGPALGGVLTQLSPVAPFFFAGVLALVNASLIAARLPETLPPSARGRSAGRQRLVDVLQHCERGIYVRAVAGYFLSITGFSILTTVWALFLKHGRAYDALHAGLLLAYVGIIGVLVQGGILRRLLKMGMQEKPLVLSGCVILAASTAWLPFTGGLASLLLACAGIALGNGFVNPVLNGLASRSVDARWQGRALGILQSSGSLGRTVGPLLAGALLAYGSDGAGMGYAVVALLVSSAITLLAMALLSTLPGQHTGQSSLVT